jgi:hypothetical protein
MSSTATVKFNGRSFSAGELALVREVVESCARLSRSELAHTVCELVGWRRQSGGLKSREALDLLAALEQRGLLVLPDKLRGRPKGSRTRVPVTQRGDARPSLEGSVDEVSPVELKAVTTAEQQSLFRELVGRYHYLGFRVPYGAHHRYLVEVSKPEPQVVGCLQFSSPAWRMESRDRWVGWSDTIRLRNLQRVVSNSRFLLLPWVRVRNLASTVLSLGARRLPADWQARYGIEPLLLETLVDASRFSGGCYRAANWVELGRTTGRGRMDREHRRHGAEVKLVFVYPLKARARQLLADSKGKR